MCFGCHGQASSQRQGHDGQSRGAADSQGRDEGGRETNDNVYLRSEEQEASSITVVMPPSSRLRAVWPRPGRDSPNPHGRRTNNSSYKRLYTLSNDLLSAPNNEHFAFVAERFSKNDFKLQVSCNLIRTT